VSSPAEQTVGATKVHQEVIVEALRKWDSEVHLRATAPDPDLHAGHINVFHVLALDIADLLSDPVVGLRDLQRLRADDRFFELVNEAFVTHIQHCGSTAQDIKTRAQAARAKQGKAVWTEHFLQRFAPLALPVEQDVYRNAARTHAPGRIATNAGDVLHHVVAEEVRLQMFRDGTIVFTLRSSFNERRAEAAGHCPPASVETIIERLAALDSVATETFHKALSAFIQPEATRQRFSQTAGDAGYKLSFAEPDALELDALRRKAGRHTIIVVENFYNDDGADLEAAPGGATPERNGRVEAEGQPADPGQQEKIVPLHTVLASSSLAGILNTASWFHTYNSRYVNQLIDKEIGYRDDEIYITDRKATVVSAAGIWDENDSLSLYINEVVLAVEYNVALLTYLGSILAYYQRHEDARTLETARPHDALKRVNEGRAIHTQIVESMDLTLLVDHGFTRVFVERLRQELGVDKALAYLRRRIEDAAASVSLRSSVNAAEHTAPRSLRNAILSRRVAIVGLLLAAASFWAGTQTSDVKLDLGAGVCLHDQPSGGQLAMLCSDAPVAPTGEEPEPTTPKKPGGNGKKKSDGA
jgi:hypothetical protein